MTEIFNAVNSFFEFIVPITDFLWDFPTNIDWYSKIPVLGGMSLAVILLLGTGIYFTFKTSFVQCKRFKRGIKILAQ